MEDGSSPSFVITTSSLNNSSKAVATFTKNNQDLKSKMLLEGNEMARPSETHDDGSEGFGKTNDEYIRKRMRNNMAVKKSRDRSKKRILETQDRVEQLTKENTELNQKVTLLSKELNVLRALFTNGGFTVPCNLQIVAQSPVNMNRPTEISETVSSSTTQPCLTRMVPESVSSPALKTHTSVIRSAASAPPCHGVILMTEPGKLNLDIQAGIQFKEESN